MKFLRCKYDVNDPAYKVACSVASGDSICICVLLVRSEELPECFRVCVEIDRWKFCITDTRYRRNSSYPTWPTFSLGRR